MASILKFEPATRSDRDADVVPEGRVVAMKHVDLEVVTDLMRLFREMDDPDYRKAYVEARNQSSSPDA